jgi:hypothetical protein
MVSGPSESFESSGFSEPAGSFNPSHYGADVARVLAFGKNGRHLAPLTCGSCVSEDARRELARLQPAELFRSHKEPEAPMAGLWLYFSCFEEAHRLIDDPRTPDGVYWHAILHRQEPDDGNAAYWFRRLGKHSIFGPLAEQARKIIAALPSAEFRVGHWDPFAFIAYCDRARRQPGTVQERAAMEIQRAEWQLLFDHCARPR